MASLSTWILPAASSVLSFLGLSWSGRRAAQRSRAFVEVQPRCRALLRQLGLTEARHFLDLSATVVSGHPGRSVARVALADGATTIHAYLKRESCVSWAMRLRGAVAGLGLASRSLREACTLKALAREKIGCPEWLAFGEDDDGRAFLLVAETPGAVELRTWLGRENDSSARLRLARSLGAALAHMHAAGFTHPDLYSKHVLVAADGETVQFLDWQRARRLLVVDVDRRARDLSALHATLPQEVASARERLTCFRAYRHAMLAAATSSVQSTGILRRILLHARRLLMRRHVREKRQLPLSRGVQEWMTLQGGELCVTPALTSAWPMRSPDWLAFDQQPSAHGNGILRRWLPTAEGPLALLVHRSTATGLLGWLHGKQPSPEQRQAELLLRLQRLAIPAPQVLAMGQRCVRGRVESFLLTQPESVAVRLTVWLKRQQGRRASRRVLIEAGALLRRLHDAACYLDERGALDGLAVRDSPTLRPAVVLTSVENVAARRRPHAGCAHRDLNAAQRALAEAGCSRADWRRFLSGYRRSVLGNAMSVSSPRRWPGYRTADSSGPQGDRAMSASPTAVAAPPMGAAPSPPAESLWSRLIRGVRRVRQRADWAGFIGADWPDRIMDAEVTDRFHSKQGRSTGRLILHGDGPTPRRLAVYLKRHHRLHWWTGVLATLFPRGRSFPAFQEWDHLEWARANGVPVPEVVAAAEYVGPWGRLCSFLAVEELADMVPINEAIPLAAAQLSSLDFRRWKRSLIDEMARLTRLLHDRRRFHKDLYLCHFYVARTDTGVAEPDWHGRVFLIDLHRLGCHPWTYPWWRTKDLAQLLYSTGIPEISVRDRVYFWRRYREPGPRRASDRWLVRLVLYKWGRYRRHNERRKARGQR